MLHLACSRRIVFLPLSCSPYGVQSRTGGSSHGPVLNPNSGTHIHRHFAIPTRVLSESHCCVYLPRHLACRELTNPWIFLSVARSRSNQQLRTAFTSFTSSLRLTAAFAACHSQRSALPANPNPCQPSRPSRLIRIRKQSCRLPSLAGNSKRIKRPQVTHRRPLNQAFPAT